MKTLSRIFKKGLIAILPIAITVYLIYWLVELFGRQFTLWADEFLPLGWNSPYFALAIGMAIIFFIGLLLELLFAARFKRWIDRLFEKLPIIGDIYASVNGLMDYLGGGSTPHETQTVLVSFGEHGYQVLGLITRDDLNNAPKGIAGKNKVAVFLPMSYQVGGYTIYVDKKHVKPIEMKKKEALRWALMAGVDHHN